jgi:hypothetical protein
VHDAKQREQHGVEQADDGKHHAEDAHGLLVRGALDGQIDPALEPLRELVKPPLKAFGHLIDPVLKAFGDLIEIRLGREVGQDVLDERRRLRFRGPPVDPGGFESLRA